MKITLKILGFITGVILIGSLMIMNAQPVKVDLVFIDGEMSCFLIIISSFLIGFFSCLVYIWLKNSLVIQKKTRPLSLKDDDIFRDI